MVISWERGKQSATTSGLGVNFQSPKKNRSSAHKTSRTAWKIFNPTGEKRKLLAQMTKLYTKCKENDPNSLEAAKPRPDSDPGVVEDSYDRSVPAGNDEPSKEEEWEDVDSDVGGSNNAHVSLSKGLPRRTAPDTAEKSLYASWRILLPTLIDDMLHYTSTTVGLPGSVIGSVLEFVCRCSATGCVVKSTQVLCLYFDHFKSVLVKSCSCKSIAQVLVQNGLFPTSPSQARMAISVDLLDFYAALFERSCDAVNAMAAAMNTFYTRRGFYLLDNKGEKYKEPFRKGLGYASQWHTKLKDLISKRVDDALQCADQCAQEAKQSNATAAKHSETSTEKPELHQATGMGPGRGVSLSECARSLRLLCPACFGSTSFGRSLLDGGDFQICTDGNFHHRHLASGGSGIPFHEAKHFIPKEFVDKVGQDIEAARHRPRKSKEGNKFKVPDVAIDECEKSYQAANGDKKKANSGNERYDDQGYMSLICRHDIPLLFANIDTPGEQQKYAIALISWFFQLVPTDATVTVLYDIGCVLDRSIQKLELFPPAITSRLLLVTTAMHAYGHQWACQLVYNPRLCQGLGLTDGEGSERVWSRLTKLIPIVRASSATRRIWLTDRQLNFIASDLLDDLGDWIKHRLSGVAVQQKKAEKILSGTGLALADLKYQWQMQKTAQLSSEAYKNIGPSKELDALLDLQGQWDDVECKIQSIKEVFALLKPSTTALDFLGNFQKSHEQINGEVEGLYHVVNIQDQTAMGKRSKRSDFFQTLRLARDLKISIRRRAIGSFFEWDRLDQAVGGRSQALGTKLHQQTRKAITRRRPALMSAISKYNTYCATLEQLYDPAYKLPLPQPLPTKLADLRDNSTLMEDVWTAACDTPPPWLFDSNVRSGIRAMLKQDRCFEESHRLQIEAENLCCWFGRELLAVELALRQAANASLSVHLTRYRDHLLHLKSRWANTIVPAAKFEAQVAEAQRLASELACGSMPIETTWQYADPASIDYELLSEKPTEIIHDSEVDDISILLASDILSVTEQPGEILPDDTSTVQNGDMISLVWKTPGGIAEDLLNVKDQILPSPSGPLERSRILGRHFFDAQDVLRLSQNKVMLNDTCLNGCAGVLKHIFDENPLVASSSSRCALFTTHDLVRARYKARDKELWRMTSPTQYWDKDVWILPIHRPRHLHWVLCIAYPRHRTVLLYDSLVGQQFWHNDLGDISNLFTRLIKLANQFGHKIEVPLSSWLAYPVTTLSVQSNNYDCGLWVLAWITAALRGFGTCSSSLTQDTLPQWRQFLAAIIASLPLHNREQ